jgi:two-component system response regulator NreC
MQKKTEHFEISMHSLTFAKKNHMDIVIIEDDPTLRADMTDFLQAQDNFRVSSFESIGAFFEHFTMDLKVDLILLDVMLNGQNSLNHMFKIKRLVPQAKVLIVTGSNMEAFLVKALMEGAEGYYLKGNDLQQLLGAIQNVTTHDAYIDPAMTKTIIKRYKSNVSEIPPTTPELQYMSQNFDLNKREMEILTGLTEGMRYKEIAERFHVSINTVRHYVLSLYRKADVNNRKDLIRKVKSLS